VDGDGHGVLKIFVNKVPCSILVVFPIEKTLYPMTSIFDSISFKLPFFWLSSKPNINKVTLSSISTGGSKDISNIWFIITPIFVRLY